jgi:putative transposase
MKHVRSAPTHPQTQGKIERWCQTLKDRILLENYVLEGELEAAIAAFIDRDNNHRYHESINTLTPVEVYIGRGGTVLAERRCVKLQTIQGRRLNHQPLPAQPEIDEPAPSTRKSAQ